MLHPTNKSQTVSWSVSNTMHCALHTMPDEVRHIHNVVCITHSELYKCTAHYELHNIHGASYATALKLTCVGRWAGWMPARSR